jgi:hypothetical protein
MIDRDLALERVLGEGNEWQSWRALRLSGEAPGPPPSIPDQDHLGGFLGPAGAPSAGATGEALCHLLVLGLGSSGPAAVAVDWLEEVPALLYAQHWAETDAEPDPQARARLVEVYGSRRARQIETVLRLIRIGNLVGNIAEHSGLVARGELTPAEIFDACPLAGKDPGRCREFL